MLYAVPMLSSKCRVQDKTMRCVVINCIGYAQRRGLLTSVPV